MSLPYKPEGYSSLSPYFMVSEPEKFIDFLKDLFEAEELVRYKQPDGSIMHAEVKIGDSVIMLSNATDEYPPTSFWMHLYVRDAKATYEKALSLGCEGLQEPVQKGDPDLRGMFRDLAGNFWAVGTRVG